MRCVASDGRWALIAHTLYQERDLEQTPKKLFEDAAQLETGPEMLPLAIQLIEGKSAQDEPCRYLEDRYETRLRAMLDAKLRGRRHLGACPGNA